MGLKLFSVVDSPPSTAVRMALKYLGVEYELVEIDMGKGEHKSEAFLKMNPMGQVPVLQDEGFILSESVAIMQYLADKFKKDETFYPEQIQKRAFVNQLLAFHLSMLYPAIGNYFVLPLIFDTEKTEADFEKLTKALKGFEGILTKQNTTYVAGNEVTIADFALVTAIICCECTGPYDLSSYPRIEEWYEEFQKTEIWMVAKECLDTLRKFSESKQ